MRWKLCVVGAVLLCTSVVLAEPTATPRPVEPVAQILDVEFAPDSPAMHVSKVGTKKDEVLSPEDEAIRQKLAESQALVSDEALRTVGAKDARQGGDTCAAAVAIVGALPATVSGTTVGYADDYDEVCPYTGSTSPDVVYVWNATVSGNVTFSLCGQTDYDSKLYIYETTCPTAGTPFACVDDACTSDLGQDYVSEIIAPVTAGNDYYIVVDGYGGASGNYELIISEAAAFGSDCPEGYLFGQNPDGTSAANSDEGSDLHLFDDFFGLTGPICDVHWWGIDFFFDGAAWSACVPEFQDPECIEIAFWNDDGTGLPDITAPACAPFVACTNDGTLTRVDTGTPFSTTTVQYYSADIPCCSLSDGWISIRGMDDDGVANCFSLWHTTAQQQGSFSQAYDYATSTWAARTYDVAFCLTGPTLPGACCDDSDGTCSDGVEAPNCPAPLRFVSGALCTELDPLCGQVPGACCALDGTCTEVTEAECALAGGTFEGNWTTCTPNPCIGACCDASGWCQQISEADCVAGGGEYKGDGTDCGPPNPCEGACCYEDGTCEVRSELVCGVLAGSYLGDGIYCDPNPCPQPRPECPEDSEYSQYPHLPDEDWVFANADADTGSGAGYLRQEYFSGLTMPITDLHWWGLWLYNVPSWAECTDSDPRVEIKFYNDDAGTPGAEACSYLVTPTWTPTGEIFLDLFDMLYFEVDLPTPCGLSEGWVSVQGVGDTTCWLMWAGSPIGDGQHYMNGAAGVPDDSDFDMSVCVTTSDVTLIGACCDDMGGSVCGDLDGDNDCDMDDYWLFVNAFGACTGSPKYNVDADFDFDGCITAVDYQAWLLCYRGAQDLCQDNVPWDACPAGFRFVPDTLCEDLDPPCGLVPGACCDLVDGTCTEVLPEDCPPGNDFLGLWTTCDPNPCAQPGDDCTNPNVLTVPADLPVNDTLGYTCGRGDAYADTCLGYYDGGEDMVYELVVTEDVQVEIIMDPMGTTWSGIVLDDTCPPDAADCMYLATGSSADPRSLGCRALVAGTYYIMVDTWPSPDCIPNFTLTIEACEPPPGRCCYNVPVECADNLEAECLALGGQWTEGITCADVPCLENDTCDTVTVIDTVPYSTTFDSSTAEANAPSCNTSYTVTQNDVWYNYTPDEDCLMIVDVFEVDSYDTVMGVYTGPDCENLTEIDCLDDPDGYHLEIAATAGTTYWFQVGDYGSTPGGGLTDFDLDCSSGTGACCIPADASCSEVGIVDCQGLGGEYMGDDTLCAEVVCTAACCYNDGSCADLSENDCVAGDGTYQGFGTDCATTTCPVTPDNNTCGGAFEVFCDDVFVGTSLNATNNYDPGSGGCANGYAEVGPDVVYSINVAVTQEVTASMNPNPSFDAAIYVVTDCADVVGTCIAGDDSGNPEEVTWTAVAGTTYYIIADSYGSSATGGTFDFSVTCYIPEEGACCVNQDCVADNFQSECVAMGGLWFAGETCATFVCPEDPLSCPPGTMQGQTPHAGDSTDLVGFPSDTGFTISGAPSSRKSADNYSVDADICDIHWWGVRNVEGWAQCGFQEPLEEPMTFEIIFYPDDGTGYPGAPACTYTVSPAANVAGEGWWGTDTLFRWDVDLTNEPGGCCTLRDGWVSIQGVSDPQTCWFLWVTSPVGDARSVLYIDDDGVWSDDPYGVDLSLCLTPPAGITGACCDDSTGICTPDTPIEECTGRFAADTTCEALDPPCGDIPGACCYPDGSCAETTQANCTGEWTEGLTCDPNPCDQPAPENDECGFATPIGEVVDLAFDTTWATDGLDGNQTICQEVWYCYTATCTGPVHISLCPSDFDTRLAVFEGCECDPLGTQLAYDDDACPAKSSFVADAARRLIATGKPNKGTLASELDFDAVAGNSYLIEVGGYLSTSTGCNTGPGTMTITCPPETGACCRDYDALCEDGIAAENCVGENDTWFPGELCADVTCPEAPTPGDTCEEPAPVALGLADLPYMDIGQTNCGRVDDYDDSSSAHCLYYYDSGEDMIYELVVNEAMDVTITLDPKTTTYAGVAIGIECPPTLNCIDAAYGSSASPKVIGAQPDCLHLEPGTYYIMVDTWSSPDCIPDFDLTIEACEVPQTGACCDPADGACTETDEAGCAGVFQGYGSECATTICGGACCHPDGSCTDELYEDACVQAGGAYEGMGTECASTDCPQPCIPDAVIDTLPFTGNGTSCGLGDDFDTTCLGSYDGGEEFIYELVLAQDACLNIVLTSDTTYTGMAIDDSCPPDDTCIDYNTSSGTGAEMLGVELVAGTYYIMLDTWPSPDCIADFTLTVEECPAGGACCMLDGSCQDVADMAACDGLGGAYEGDGTSCATTDCPLPCFHDTCADPGMIAALPFTDMGNTCSCANDFINDGSCPYSSSGNGPDVVYEYTPAADECVVVSLCQSSFDTALLIYDQGCGVDPLFACGDDEVCSSQTELTVNLIGGTTYFFVVDGYGTNCGDFQIDVTACPPPLHNSARPVHADLEPLTSATRQ